MKTEDRTLFCILLFLDGKWDLIKVQKFKTMVNWFHMLQLLFSNYILHWKLIAWLLKALSIPWILDNESKTKWIFLLYLEKWLLLLRAGAYPW